MKNQLCKFIALLLLFTMAALGPFTFAYAEEEPRGELWYTYGPRMSLEHDGQTYGLKDGLTTMLLMGIDSASGEESTGYRDGGQADFLLYIVLDENERTITAIQIDRDTMAEIAILGVMGDDLGFMEAQICLAHGFGDTEEVRDRFVVDAVSKLLLGMPVDFYFAMNFDGIPTLNDLVGGVTVTLEDDFSALDELMTPGTTLTLEGKQAEYYVRNRIDIGDGTNEARTYRQDNYMRILSGIVNEKLRENAGFIGRILDEMKPYLNTDMSRGRSINEAWKARDYTLKEVMHLKGEYVIGEDGFVEFHVDQEHLISLMLILFFA